MGDDDAPRIGERARAVRERLGLNQSDIAERVGISLEVYGRFERGVVTPRLSTLLRMCDVLGVEPNDLLLDARPAKLRNDGLSAELRQLVAVLADADAATVKRVTEIARWLKPAAVSRSRTGGSRRKRS